MRATGDEADSDENMFHLHFHFHGNEDSCTETRFEREAKATPREWHFKDTCFLAPRLEWSGMFLYPLNFFCTVRLSADWLLKYGLIWVHWRTYTNGAKESTQNRIPFLRSHHDTIQRDWGNFEQFHKFILEIVSHLGCPQTLYFVLSLSKS